MHSVRLPGSNADNAVCLVTCNGNSLLLWIDFLTAKNKTKKKNVCNKEVMASCVQL